MRWLSAAIGAVALSSLLGVPASAEGQGLAAANVYRDQFLALHDRIGIILNKSKSAVLPGATRNERSALSDELLATMILVHRLEEETAGSAIKQAIDPAVAKRLRLVAQGCGGLDFVIAALQNFLDTEDNAFLGFANDPNNIVVSVRKLL